MVAKLGLVLAVVAVVCLGAVVMAFWYFNQESERQHEKDKWQHEQTDEIMEYVEDDDEL